MHKLLTLFCLFISSATLAQSSSLVGPEVPAGGTAINIAVSSYDDRNGDDFFSEADRIEKKGDLFNAMTLFGKAAFEYNSAHQFNNYGSALLRLSNVHLLLNNYIEAEQVVLNVALKNYSRIHSTQGQMNSYKQLAKIYLAANRLTEALWFSTQQGILARQLNSKSGNIESILGIANVKIKKKQFTLAKKDLNQAEMLAKSSNSNAYRSEINQVRRLIPGRVTAKK
jgi:tetratricopeptide (TPR) repeat protein